MSVIVETQSGSRYEFDTDLKKVRRLGNKNGNPPTDYMGQDGWWKEYEWVRLWLWPDGNPSLIIWWAMETHTRTSPLVDTSVVVELGMGEWIG